MGRLLALALTALVFAGQALAIDVQISQLVDTPDPAVRGGEITYTITVENGDPDTAPSVVLSVPLPATTTFASVSGDPGCSHDGGTPGTVTCSFGDLVGSIGPAPADIRVVDVVVSTTAATPGTIGVTATADATPSDGSVGNNTLTQNTTVNDGADLSVTKTDSPDPVAAAGLVSYDIVVSNAGPNASSSLIVTDTLPAAMTYQSASGSGWSCGNSGQTVTCTRATLANGAVAPIITLVGKVTGAVTGNITNAVTVTATTGDPDPNNNTTTEDTTVTIGTDLAITKQVSAPVIGGATATFTLLPRNLGPFAASNVSVSDTLPAGFTVVTANGVGWSCGVAGQTVTCTRASYAVGATDNISIQATAPASGSFTNTADIASTTVDPITGNDSGSVNFNIVPDGADLSVTKTKSPNPVAQGANLTSTIRVRNNGPQTTTGVITVTDTLSLDETYQSFSGTNWSCGAAGSPETVTCTYSGAALASGQQTSVLTITTLALNAGSLSNTACASDAGGQPDGVVSNDCVTRTSTSTAQQADLQIAKSATTPDLNTTLADIEDRVTYTLTVTNNGPDTVSGVVVTDTVPGFVSGAGGTAISVSDDSGGKFSCSTNAGNGTVTCTMLGGQNMLNGETVVFTVLVDRPLFDGSLTNTASVNSTVLGDPDRGNNSATANVTVEPVADLQLVTKTVTPGSVQAGTNATYVITVRNNGPSTSQNVQVSDVFTTPGGDTGYTFISATPTQGSCAGFNAGTETLDCSIGNLINGQTETITVVIRPNWMSGEPTRTLPNTATVSSTTTTDRDNSNDQQSASLTILPSALDLLVNKTDLVDPGGYDPRPGFESNNIITYRIDVTNQGPSLATGVVLSDTMAPKASKTVRFLCDKANAGDDCSVVSGSSLCDNLNTDVTGPATLTMNCNLADLPATATTTRYLDFQVITAPDAAGDIHNNSAGIAANETDIQAANDTEGESTTFKKRVDLSMTKVASQATVQLREPFDWTLTVTNNGPGDSDTTTVTDTLPAGMVFHGATPSWSNTNTAPASGTCGVAGQVLTCNLGLLESTRVATITVPVRVNTYAASYTNCGTATTDQTDPISGNSVTQCGSVNVQRSSIAGIVYRDLNDNGTQQGGETGIQGVTVTLTGTDAYGNPVSRTATTNASGAFTINNLSPADAGGYTLTETQPAGFYDGQDYDGSAVIANSKTTDVITSIALAGNTALTGFLFGELPGTGISGYVWHDTDNDGVRDGGEATGVNGVTITLSGTDDLGDPVSTTATSGADGSYSFTSLRPGTYTLTETAPTGWLPGRAAAGTGATSAGTPDNVPASIDYGNVIADLVLSAGDAAIEYNFGELQAASLSGTVFNDNDNNGALDAGEPGIGGVTIDLTGTDDLGNAVSTNTTTAADGTYSFAGLRPGTYALTESQPPIYVDGDDTAGTLGGTVANDQISAITVASGDTGTGYLFAERSAGLAGSVFVDSNNDGMRDPGEVGIPNVTISVTGTDAGGNPVNRTGLTDSNGDYLITGLPASNGSGYTVTETQPAAWLDGLDSVGSAGGMLGNDIISGVVLAATDIAAGYDFGERGGSLSGFVYNDLSNDGVKDAAEPGIPGVIVTLSGTDIDGNAISLVATTDAGGAYRFSDLPRPNGSGYTLTETQPAGNADGLDTLGTLGGSAGNDVFSGILFPSAGATGTGYNFGESTATTADVSGKVWLDTNHDRLDNDGTGEAGWTVEIIQRADPLDNSGYTLIASTSTAAGGNYDFTGLIPGAGYEIRFRHPNGGYVYGTPISTEPGVDFSYGTIRNLTLAGGANVLNQSLPVDPSGVVYDALTRAPVPGAVVTLNGPAGFDPALHLIGGSTNQVQTTGADGLYQYLLLATAPAGTYTLTVVEPAGYIPGGSAIIPVCTNTPTVGAAPDPALVHAGANAPAAAAPIHDPATCPVNSAMFAATAASTQYYLSFVLTPGTSADVLNNHVPLDPVTDGAITLIKSTPSVNVVRGDLVPYTIRMLNNLSATIPNMDLYDQIPPGFKYKVGTALLDGVPVEPQINGRSLTWPNLSFSPAQERVVKLVLVVGSGVSEGDYVNQAWVMNNLVGATVSNIGTATVRVVPDPTFDCSDIIGKVFDDRNANGYQDQGEPGIAGVRVVTVRGLLVTTDEHGRFHVACADVPNEDRGANFIMKLDERSLPSGYRVTTENPRVVRVTRGKLTRLDFGAAIHRVVRLDLTAAAFADDSTDLRPEWEAQVDRVVDLLKQQPSVLRIGYQHSGTARTGLADERIDIVSKRFRQLWGESDCCYPLMIETETHVVDQPGGSNR
ncbi:MAG: SpaA isopeptide-forming pilin-related protein [Gammaproteobacteria bacterium]|nr:SpaA isopeptide-forming pilin-related protein [Gammaproteobacteria bacterium]